MKLIALLATLLVAAPAAAAPRDDMSPEETRAAVYEFARCSVKNNRRRAGEIILADPDPETIVKKYGRFLSSACLLKAAEDPNRVLGVQMTLPGDVLQYAVADALVAMDLPRTAPTDFSAVPPLRHRAPELKPEPGKPLSAKQKADLQTRIQRQTVDWFLARFGECVVRADPANARALLASDLSSREEEAAFTALRPSFNGCFTDGQSASISKLMMRGTIAINYYRLAKAPRVPAAGVSS